MAEIIHITADGMFRVIKSAKSGLFFPQYRTVSTPETGRVYTEEAVQRYRDAGIWTISDSGFRFYAGTYSGIKYNGHKSFKTEKGAVAFVNRYSEALAE